MLGLPKRLAPRLIVSLTILLVLIEGSFAYFNIRLQEQQLIDEVIEGADQLSQSITSATWHAMLADRREDAYEVMESIGRKQRVEAIRLYNREGRVTFATDRDAGPVAKLESKACQVCHAYPEPLVELDAQSRSWILSDDGGRRKLALVSAFYNEPSCVTECHAHPAEVKVLGVLDLEVDLEHVDEELAGLTRRAAATGLTHVVALGLFVYLFTRYFVGGPIRKLIAGTKAVSEMDLDKPIDVHASTELGELAEQFNAMRTRLRAARQEVEEFAQSLEDKVELRSRQLAATRQKLIQSDRLASLGQLSATVAHEINNPMGSVLNLSMILQRLLTDEGIPEGREQEFRKYLTQITDETTRVGNIVKDLLSFSRQSKPQIAEVDLNDAVRHTVSLVSHKLELSNVVPRFDLGSNLPKVVCDRSQIEQVVLNLVMNSAEALPAGGVVLVRTGYEPESDHLVLAVEDAGPGIPERHLALIFDPFFTTKEEGKGVGLGLAVVYGIVNAHGGSIDVTTAEGEGTVFTIRLPREGRPAGEGNEA